MEAPKIIQIIIYSNYKMFYLKYYRRIPNMNTFIFREKIIFQKVFNFLRATLYKLNEFNKIQLYFDKR